MRIEEISLNPGAEKNIEVWYIPARNHFDDEKVNYLLKINIFFSFFSLKKIRSK